MSPDRYSRQERFAPIGAAGQRRLGAARVAVVGCGALGAACAEQLARAGVGRLTLIDRDVVEASNLQRQCLYTEADASAGTPKALAAVRRLAERNVEVVATALVEDLHAGNALRLLAGHDLVLDGTDNFAARHLINEVCVRSGTPWIHGACVGAYGVSLPIMPGEGPCWRCLQDELPAPGEAETCDSAGIIAPAVQLVAAWQVAEALKILVGDRAAVRRALWACDLWKNTFQRLDLSSARDPSCAVCGPAPTWPALTQPPPGAVVLCGRDAVQVRLPARPDLSALLRRLPGAMAIEDVAVRWQDGAVRATCFADGRVLVQGVTDGPAARTFIDRWL